MPLIKASWRTKSGILYARFKHPLTGEPVERSTGTGSKRLAAAWLEAQWAVMLAPGEAALPTFTLGEAVETYLEARSKAVEAGVSGEGTAECLHSRRKKLHQVVARLGAGRQLAEIGKPDLLSWRDARLLEVSASTVHKELNELRMCLRWAVERGHLRADPTDGIRVEVVHKKIDRSLTAEQVMALFEAASPARRLYLQLLVETGVRPGHEVEGIRWGDVLVERGLLHVRGTKTAGSDRHVPLRASFLATLAEARAASGAADDEPVVAPWANARRDLDLLCAKVGLPHVRPYDLRHVYASFALQGGASDVHVAKALGHANTTMVHRTYGHLRPEHLFQVSEALPDLSPSRPQAELAQPLPKNAHEDPSKFAKTHKNKNPGEVRNLPGLLSFSCAQGRNRTSDTGIFRKAADGLNCPESRRFLPARRVIVRRMCKRRFPLTRTASDGAAWSGMVAHGAQLRAHVGGPPCTSDRKTSRTSSGATLPGTARTAKATRTRARPTPSRPPRLLCPSLAPAWPRVARSSSRSWPATSRAR